MKKSLFAALIIFSACSPKPCEQWKGWDFPKLKKITSCFEGQISLELSGEPQTLWEMFEKRGYERGYSEAKLIMNDDSAVFAKKGDPVAYSVTENGRELTIASRPAKEVKFLSLAELARVEGYPQSLMKWHASLKGFPALFDASSKDGPCDRALLSEALRPLTLDSKVPFLLNVDQLASGGETRLGVPTLLRPHERTAPIMLRNAAAELASLESRKAIVAFRVKNYVEPLFVNGKRVEVEDGTVIEHYSPGILTLELALIELGTPRVICRATVSARSSSSLNPDANFDLDLQMNVGLAVQSAFSFR
jgi:hypothetical protein